MPHINIKCYPKNLNEQEMNTFVSELTHLIEKHLKSPEEYISISYTEISAEHWKDEVFDPEIRPNMDHLAKKPGYDM